MISLITEHLIGRLVSLCLNGHLAGARIMDDGDVVGRDHRADYTFERYIWPVC